MARSLYAESDDHSLSDSGSPPSPEEAKQAFDR
eukprot:CAMPEP_0185623092 /NCGR_PEP_ID=MMETSP0436-20130131/59638_1 /TAXON_ID=626734 ORGANISM="Favella taraikaensis, Strain Fe Narragansett Bay" /NCGR_SAMPLE_ID=MMETSP0436 /ASSEMBLY_ACC=CAM_ASM_000390 /LENGTH=32 /DNA_ID= /DNA_START= /DNA_END= /DNA_ORIENTATION=